MTTKWGHDAREMAFHTSGCYWNYMYTCHSGSKFKNGYGDNSKFLGIKMSWYDYEKRHIFFIGRDHDRTIEYVYNSDGYAGYPPFTLDDHYTFIFKKRSFPEKVFSMKKQLSDGDYFFNSNLKSGLVRPENEMLARLEGNILVIRCEKVHKGINEELLLKIDLEAEGIISAQPYVLKK